MKACAKGVFAPEARLCQPPEPSSAPAGRFHLGAAENIVQQIDVEHTGAASLSWWGTAKSADVGDGAPDGWTQAARSTLPVHDPPPSDQGTPRQGNADPRADIPTLAVHKITSGLSVRKQLLSSQSRGGNVVLWSCGSAETDPRPRLAWQGNTSQR